MKYLFCIFLCIFFLCSCSINKSVKIKAATWNVQSLFDCEKDGCEYKEYTASLWDKEKYIQRLMNLCKVIKKLDCDVIVMQELEKKEILYDIYNFMAGEWNGRKVYRYGCFCKTEGAAIGIGVLSRYPLKDMSVHSVCVKDFCNKNERMPLLRPVLKVNVIKNNKNITLLCCHFKSKSGGTDFKKWQKKEETVLYSLFEQNEKNKMPCIALGDFNKDINEYTKSAEGKILIAKGQYYGIWNKDINNEGSYFFDGKWECIDNFFVNDYGKILDYCVNTDGEWYSCIYNRPYKYSIWNGKGYSDHLPVECIIEY